MKWVVSSLIINNKIKINIFTDNKCNNIFCIIYSYEFDTWMYYFLNVNPEYFYNYNLFKRSKCSHWEFTVIIIIFHKFIALEWMSYTWDYAVVYIILLYNIII